MALRAHDLGARHFLQIADVVAHAVDRRSQGLQPPDVVGPLGRPLVHHFRREHRQLVLHHVLFVDDVRRPGAEDVEQRLLHQRRRHDAALLRHDVVDRIAVLVEGVAPRLPLAADAVAIDGRQPRIRQLRLVIGSKVLERRIRLQDQDGAAEVVERDEVLAISAALNFTPLGYSPTVAPLNSSRNGCDVTRWNGASR